MASNDARPSEDGATSLVPEVTNQTVPLEPVAGAAAAAPFTGQNNAIDPWIFENFVQAPNGEFTISPRNSVGEILLKIPLTPNLNPFLAHLSRMYNAWAGGMEAQLILAGNAFTAGKLLIAAVPPGFDPDQLTPAQATAMPHVLADVRTLEPIPIPLPDIRNLLFHYNGDPNPTVTIVVMLYTPLRTNGNGDDVFTVSGRLLTRPTPDFSFSFLVPPGVEQKTTPFTLPNLDLREMCNSRFDCPLTNLRADGNANLVENFQNGRCTLDGQLLGTTPNNAGWIGYMRGEATHVNNNNITVQLSQPWGEEYNVVSDELAPQGVPDYKCQLALYVDWENKAHGLPCRASLDTRQGGEAESWAYTPGLGSLTFVRETGDTPEVGDRLIMRIVAMTGALSAGIPRYDGELGPGSPLAPPVTPPVPGESILFFNSAYLRLGGSQLLTIPCLLPREWITHFFSQGAPTLGDAALLRYVQPEQNRILFECKLYREGFVTVANAGAPAKEFPVDGTFVFVSWVSKHFSLSPVGTSTGRRRLAPSAF